MKQGIGGSGTIVSARQIPRIELAVNVQPHTGANEAAGVSVVSHIDPPTKRKFLADSAIGCSSKLPKLTANGGRKRPSHFRTRRDRKVRLISFCRSAQMGCLREYGP